MVAFGVGNVTWSEIFDKKVSDTTSRSSSLSAADSGAGAGARSTTLKTAGFSGREMSKHPYFPHCLIDEI